jgi:hypothetical protein
MEQKRVGIEETSIDNERERESETERCYERVAVWVINLTVGQVFKIARERIIRGLIKMNIKIIQRI